VRGREVRLRESGANTWSVLFDKQPRTTSLKGRRYQLLAVDLREFSMTSAAMGERPPATELGALLKDWRARRGKSQLDLSLDTGVSQRHISFVESGRSVPSRVRLLDLAEALDVPLRERNTLLLAAGYAPIFAEGAWDEPEMSCVSNALKRLLHQHEPFPAFVMDRYWNVLMTNEAAPRFFGHFIDLHAHPKPRNLLRLVFDPSALRPFIVNWEEASRGLLARIYRESVGRSPDGKTKALLGELMSFPDVKAERTARNTSDSLPVIPIAFAKGSERLSYFSIVATVGAPQAIVAAVPRRTCRHYSLNVRGVLLPRASIEGR
jgi:transcriptional regulator with XRE-family HTH domain